MKTKLKVVFSQLAMAIALVGVLAFAGATSAHAGITPTPFIDWNKGHALQGSNPFGDDPRVIFGFNPQPDPPVIYRQILNMDRPEAPEITNSGNFGPGSVFDLFLTVGLGGREVRLTPGELPPGPVKSLGLGAFNVDGIKLFDVFLDFQTSTGGVLDGASAVMFNPQPDPPGDFTPNSDFGLSFTFTSFSDVSVALRMVDAQGNPIAFQQVPEPGTLTLLGIGLAALVVTRRRL